MSTIAGTLIPLGEAAIDRLERLLSIPLDSLVLKFLELEHYSGILSFLPWDNRFQVAMVFPTAVQTYGKVLTDFHKIEYPFSIITPLTPNAETARSAIDGFDGAVHRTTGLVCSVLRLTRRQTLPLPLRREVIPQASPPFLLHSTRSRSLWPIFFTFSSMTILKFITRC